MYIDYLANHRAFEPQVAKLLCEVSESSFACPIVSGHISEDESAASAVTSQLPLTLIAIDRGVLAGGGSIRFERSVSQAEPSAWLVGVFVAPQYRGTGVGTSLLHALERKAAKLTVSTLYMSAEHAEAFYSRRGWIVIEPTGGRAAADIVVMQKQLVAS